MAGDSIETVRAYLRAFVDGSIDLGALDSWLAEHAGQPRSADVQRLEGEAAHLLAWWDDGVYDEAELRRKFADLLDGDATAAPPTRATDTESGSSRRRSRKQPVARGSR